MTPLCIAVLLAFASDLSAASFLDDFSMDTSSNYKATDTFGSGGMFTILGGTLNLSPAGSNTHDVFHQTARLEVGEFVRVTVPAGTVKDFFLTTSTTDRGPNTGSEDGIRFVLASNGTFESRVYRDGAATTTSYAGSPAGWIGDMTIYIYRDSATQYRVGYDTGSGIDILDTITITQTAAVDSLYVGVEAFGGGVRNFDNLEIGTTAEQPTISNFSVSATAINAPGQVTFTWSVSNTSTVTLNGQDVSGQSPLSVLVNQTQNFILLVVHSNGAAASQAVRVVVGEGESFSIAAVADPQYADVPVGWRGGGREPEEGVNRLTHAVTQYNQRNLDWGVVLGDMIDFDDIDYGNPPPGTASGTHDWSNADAILAAWNQLNIPRYHVLGNHEFYVPNADTDGMKKPYSVFRKFGFDQQPYFSFRHKGFRFITIMADWRYLDFDPSLPEFTVAKNYYDDFTGVQKQWWNGAVSLKQRRWLMDLLDESLALGEPVICMAHDPIHQPFDGHSMLNSVEMLDILNGYPNVAMWLDGHNHSGEYDLEGRRHHLNLKGMQNEATSWYQLDFSPAQITVYKAENTTTPVYDLNILRPLPTVTSPTGFTVEEATGNASLIWDVEPAGATHVVIERRHVTTLNAELPSTAQTLSWQTVTTLAMPTTQTYLDAPSHPISEYKYRIRFLGGAEGSHHSQALAPDEIARMSYEDYAAGLGAGYELPGADADGDGKGNVLEQFYGTPPGTAEIDAARELRITRTPAGVVQLVFSYDASTLISWDIALSNDLSAWKSLSKDVDYRIALTEIWTPAGSSQSLTRVTLEIMDTSSFDFNSAETKYFMRLVVTPSS